MRELTKEEKKQLEAISQKISADMNRILNPTFIQDILDTQTKMAKSIEPVLKSISQTIKPLVEAYEGLDIEALEDFEKEFGWLETIPLIYANELSKKFTKEGKNDAWELLVTDAKKEIIPYLRSRMHKVKILQKRKHIIFQSLEHHESTNYVSSIPLLLSQIEGILWDLAVVLRGIEDKPNSRLMLDEKGNIKTNHKGEPITAQITEVLHIVFDRKSPFNSHAKDAVYKDGFRNSILHGRNVSYAEEKRSAMLIWMLVVVFDKSKEVEASHDRME